MNAAEVKKRLNANVEAVCAHLLPNGKRKGGEWVCGNVRGDEGDSLQVRLVGDRAGLFCDFASPTIAGDLFVLWGAVRECDFAQAFSEAKAWLGVRPEHQNAFKGPKNVKYRRPSIGTALEITPQYSAYKYLTAKREIDPEVLTRYKIRTEKHPKHGATIVFPFYDPGEDSIAMVKYLAVNRGEDGKKTVWSSADSMDRLFGWQAIDGNCREVFLTEGECLLGSTEVLTPKGWMSLASYQGGPVAQWLSDGATEWVLPSAKIDREHNGDMIRFNDRFVTMTVTPGHRMPGIDLKGRLVVDTAAERETGRHTHHRLPRSGIMSGNGIGLSDDQLAFCLAISADATVDVRKQSGNKRAAADRYARITLYRPRKVERMTGILERLGIKHCRTENRSNPQRSDGVFFGIPLPNWVPGRMLPWEWIERATKGQREFLIEELRHWDGNAVNGRNQYEFATKHTELADWVQALCHTSGRCSTIMRRTNKFGTWLKVSILNGKSDGSYQCLKPERVRHDGRVYCLTVPSGMFLARENGRVFVTGNCDTLTLATWGFPALSVPRGVKSFDWIEHDYDALERFEKIYICTDHDKPGEDCAEQIAQRLGRERCYRIQLPDGYKDANEALCSGRFNGEDFEACVQSARTLDPEALRPVEDYIEATADVFWPPDPRMEGTIPPIGIDFRTRPGEVSMWTGYSGHGKSLILNQFALADADQGERICIASFEIPVRKTVSIISQMALGHKPKSREELSGIITSRLVGKFWFLDQVGAIHWREFLPSLAYASRRYGCSRFIIDSLLRCGISDDDYPQQKEFVDALVGFAAKHDCHVHLVAHSKKQTDESKPPGKFDVMGGASMTNLVQNGFTVWRDKAKETALSKAQMSGAHHEEVLRIMGGADAQIQMWKQRETGTEPFSDLWIDKGGMTFSSENVGRNPVVYGGFSLL